ncbi:MAG: class I SAM-dependent methyltransferase [Gammaproteobacteria bacterium]
MGKKQPKLVLRESCIFDLAGTWEPASFLETGAGTGKMTQLFLDRGFHGACYELGRRSREMLRQNLLPEGDKIRVVDDLAELTPESFDYLFSFEVLEHIENDESALAEWTRYLKRGGRLLISVPARMRKYGKSDEIVGHVRRYEKADLTAMLEHCGYADIRFASYGFPLTEITRHVSNWLVRNERAYKGLSMEQRSTQSSYRRPGVIDRGVALFGGSLVRPFCVIQRMFYRTDLGDGYVVQARKPEE